VIGRKFSYVSSSNKAMIMWYSSGLNGVLELFVVFFCVLKIKL